VTRDADKRARALADGEEWLRSGPHSHNSLYFYRDAIDVCLHTGDLDGVDRYASALDAFMQAEPLPWASFIAARGRILAAHARGARSAEHMTRLRRLLDQARTTGLALAARALAAALDTP